MRNKYKILFSDIGGVLLTNGWPYASRKEACERFGLDLVQMDSLHNFIFNVYEMGKITLDDYLNIVVFHEPRSFTRDEFKDFMFAQSQMLPEMLPWLIDWKKRHSHIKVISINNEARELNRYRIEKFGLHLFFDAFVSSCEVEMRKPDPEIFRLALGIAQVNPEECLYFDDREMLVGAARSEGIEAYHHTSVEQTKNIILEAFGE